MTGAELILAALAAGAGAGTSDAAKTAVLDAYTGLLDAVRNRLAGRERARQVLDGARSESGVWQTELALQLEESGAAFDDEVLTAARRLLVLADPGGIAADRYQVDARGAKGVVPAGNAIRAGQAACSYSWRMPPRRSRRRMVRWARRSGSVMGSGSGTSGRALAMP
jgi:hypothetical protein